MTSASAPSSVVSQEDNSPATAFCQRARNRSRMLASKASSRLYQRSSPAARQKARTSSGSNTRMSPSLRDRRVGSLGRRSLFFIAQLAAQDLADIGLRQSSPELDLLRHLVGGELGGAELDHVLGGEAWVLLDDEGLDGLAGPRVLHADHGAFQHARMACDHFLDLVRIDVEAGDEDHILLAVDDLGGAVSAHHADVASAEIAVRGHHLRGLVRPVPVTGHHLWTLRADFARLAEWHFVAVVVADR